MKHDAGRDPRTMLLSGFIVSLKKGRNLTNDERQELTLYLEWCRDQRLKKEAKLKSIKKIMRG